MEIDELLDGIEKASDMDMSEIIKALIRRNNRVHPEQETIFLSLPRNDREERERLLMLAASLMDRENDD